MATKKDPQLKNVQILVRAVIDALEDVKAQHIEIFDTTHLSSLFERVIVASGTSNRQTKALASSVRDKVKAANLPKPRIEGEENGEWIIVDCDSVVVHIMQPVIRQYYHLEEIWGDKPITLKAAKSMRTFKEKSTQPEGNENKLVTKKASIGKPVQVTTAKKPVKSTKSEAKALPSTEKIGGGTKKLTTKTSVGNKTSPIGAKTTARKSTEGKASQSKEAPTQKNPRKAAARKKDNGKTPVSKIK